MGVYYNHQWDFQTLISRNKHIEVVKTPNMIIIKLSLRRANSVTQHITPPATGG
jgi:hypothetical protein